MILTDSLHEGGRSAAHIAHVNAAILKAVRMMPPPIRVVIQALRGVVAFLAVTSVAVVGQLLRFRTHASAWATRASPQ